jgi:hypothetical protein
MERKIIKQELIENSMQESSMDISKQESADTIVEDSMEVLEVVEFGMSDTDLKDERVEIDGILQVKCFEA